MVEMVEDGIEPRRPLYAEQAPRPYVEQAPQGAAHALHLFLSAFPLAFFSLALVTDIAYANSGNLMWQYFSIWLITAGLIMGGLGAIAGIVGWFVERSRGGVRRGTGWHLLLGISALLVALLNALVHSRDGWTAVVPQGLILSLVTVTLMLIGGIVAGFAARRPVTATDVRELEYAA